MSISSDYKSLNRFSPNVTFIIFKQLISLDETEKDCDPTGGQSGGWGERGHTRVNLQMPPALSREGEREREREVEVMFFKKLS